MHTFFYSQTDQMAIELTDGSDNRLKLVNTNICFYRIQMAWEFASWHSGGIERAFLHDYRFSLCYDVTWHTVTERSMGTVQLSHLVSDISSCPMGVLDQYLEI